MLFTKIHKYKKNIALLDEKKNSFSYEDIIIKSKNIKKKIKNRSLILFICENNIASILYYISLTINKHALILVDDKLDNSIINSLIKKYKPQYIVSTKIKNKSFIDKVLGVSLTKINFKNNKLLNEDLSLLLSTSGSLGSSKFVKLSFENLKSNTINIIKYLKINFKDRAMTNMSFSYSYMLSIINTHIEMGASIFVSNRTMIDKIFWDNYINYKITSFNGVPYIYEIAMKFGLEKFINKNTRYLTQAGGHLEKKIKLKIINYCKKNKKKFFSMYGQTEASPRIAYLEWKNAFKKINSIGKPIYKTKMYLIDDYKKKINKKNKIGQIVVEGENVFLGYAKNFKDLKKENDNDKNILYTGDLGYFDKENFFYLSGRIKRIAKIQGNRINLDELEFKLKEMGFEVICKENNKKISIHHEKKYARNKILDQIIKLSNINKFNFDFVKHGKFPRTKNGKIALNEF
jgi:acyl-CoA synthetase (AMP-forming)/AMP-acid ligase II